MLSGQKLIPCLCFLNDLVQEKTYIQEPKLAVLPVLSHRPPNPQTTALSLNHVPAPALLKPGTWSRSSTVVGSAQGMCELPSTSRLLFWLGELKAERMGFSCTLQCLMSRNFLLAFESIKTQQKIKAKITSACASS